MSYSSKHTHTWVFIVYNIYTYISTVYINVFNNSRDKIYHKHLSCIGYWLQSVGGKPRPPLAPVVRNIFGADVHIRASWLSFPKERREKMWAQFFLPIDQTADRSIWHQGYWSLRSSIAGRFQMQMYLNNNLWQHTNSLTNCRQTLYKHPDSMRKWFFFLSTPKPLNLSSEPKQSVLTVGCRLRI